MIAPKDKPMSLDEIGDTDPEQLSALAEGPSREPGEVERLAARYAGLDGSELLRALIGREFFGRLAVVSSFGAESAVILAMVADIDATTPVLFLDTGKLFGETLRYRDRLIDRLGLADERGDIRPDRHRLGLDVSTSCALRNRGGEIWQRLYAVGPVTRPVFWEVTSVPDIRRQCEALAGHLAARLAAARPGHAEAAMRQSVPAIAEDGDQHGLPLHDKFADHAHWA